MKLISLRIENFKSIVDTGWVSLSKDGISCLIGQNESGKSSVLEALYSFGTEKLQEDFLRNDMTYPRVSCKFELDKTTANKILSMFSKSDSYKELVTVFEKLNNVITVTNYTAEDGSLGIEFRDYDKELEDLLASQPVPSKQSTGTVSNSAIDLDELEAKHGLSWRSFTTVWEKFQPTFILFNDETNLLPNEISIDDLMADEEYEGKQAALNLLAVAGIEVERLEKGSARAVKQYMSESNKKVTTKFQEFWTQKIGKGDKIEVEIELNNRDSKHKKAGEQYLQFWIKDAGHTLHPKQRSKGVRWFISFYISLKADAIKDKDSKSIFLIDEPGANLHARAQEDVLRVFEDIRKSNQILYSTHSQHLVEFDNLYRLLAVQRKNESDENSDTTVLSVHQLGSASTNTLAPILAHMGIDFSHQNVISRDNNIILEEVSAMYYFKAFEILKRSSKYNYLPATGVTNVEQLVSLFLGWGLKFSVVFDDDSSGRGVYQRITKNVYFGNEEEARKHIYKIKKCAGIEDLFSRIDFVKYLVKRQDAISAEIENKANSEIAKLINMSKAMAALDFYVAVKAGEISWIDLDNETKKHVDDLFENIDRLISNQATND